MKEATTGLRAHALRRQPLRGRRLEPRYPITRSACRFKCRDGLPDSVLFCVSSYTRWRMRRKGAPVGTRASETGFLFAGRLQWTFAATSTFPFVPFLGTETGDFENFLPMSPSDAELIRRIADGDEQAAALLFDRFVVRLIKLVARQLSPRLARRVDPDDVVQSACRSFFRRACAGQYEVQPTDSLWQLLAAITVNKTRKTVRYHTAQKRTIEAEDSTSSGLARATVSPETLAREPTPDEAAVMREETEAMMRRRSPLHRQVLEYHLQGYSEDETSRMVRCSERTVRRALELASGDLSEQLRGA